MKKIVSIFLLSALLGACGSDSTDTANTTPTTDSLDFTYKPTQQTSVFDDLNTTEETQGIKTTNSFFNTDRIKAQVFEIDPTKPNTITGENGISVYIPANSFSDKNGALVTNKISFELKEVITKKDMILSGLCTVTDDGELLESAGMFYLNATCDGNPIYIADNAALDVEVPTTEIKKNMKFWDGVDTKDGILWNNPRDLDQMKVLPCLNNEEIRTCGCRENGMDVQVVLTSNEIDTGFLVRYQNKYIGSTLPLVPEHISCDEYRMLNQDEKLNFTSEKFWSKKYVTECKDSANARLYRGEVPNNINCEGGLYKRSARISVTAELPNKFTGKIAYGVQVRKFGWGNCDQIVPSFPYKRKETTIVVSLDTKNFSPNAKFDIRLVVKNKNINVPASRWDINQFAFKAITKPRKAYLKDGEETLIIAVVEDKGRTFMADCKFTVGAEEMPKLNFTPVLPKMVAQKLEEILN